MNRTDRLYALAEELRAAGRRGRTGAWLAQRLEVSGRTVKRDVSSLQQVGVPIWGEAGLGGGYVLDEVATLPPLAMTAAEATAVALALAAMPSLPFAPDGRSALTKVLASMPERERDRAVALGARLWLRGADVSRPAVARTLEEALRHEVVVVLDYADAAGTATSRRPVEPMALASTRGNWYLLAWCRTRRDGRWFRLDRVTGATLTHEVVSLPRSLEQTFGTPPSDARPLALR